MATQIIATVIIGAVEGITEFLPISSTAHVLWVGSALNYTVTTEMLLFTQLGAVLAALLYYRQRLFWILRFIFSNSITGTESRLLTFDLFIAFLPIVVVGFLLPEAWLISMRSIPYLTHACILIGGALLLIANRLAHPNKTISKNGPRPISCGMRPWQALIIGLAQTFAILPGISRSGLTITAALMCRVPRAAAVEFSFLLALPTIFCASFYTIVKHGVRPTTHAPELLIGSFAAFIVAILVVGSILRFISTSHGILCVGLYRIFIGIVFIMHSLS